MTLSLKIYGGLCAHKDILEGGKSHDIKSLLGLGETLKVGEEIFENIDKVSSDTFQKASIKLCFFCVFFMLPRCLGSSISAYHS